MLPRLTVAPKIGNPRRPLKRNSQLTDAPVVFPSSEQGRLGWGLTGIYNPCLFQNYNFLEFASVSCLNPDEIKTACKSVT